MRIVVVEDEPKSREGLVNVIQRFTEYEIAGIGENGEEGFALVKEKRPDLVISDIKMPVLDGLGMLQKIKDEQIEIQAILLTGYSEFEYARAALRYNACEYFDSTEKSGWKNSKEKIRNAVAGSAFVQLYQ